MSAIDHEFWARKILFHLVERIKDFSGGEKFITYGSLAVEIGYPKPHIGSLFARNIGNTLGTMGDLFLDKYVDGMKVPMIQALVVGQTKRVPSDGIKEFYAQYPQLSTTKKRDFAYSEWRKVFEFGDRWTKLLVELGIDIDEPVLEGRSSTDTKPRLYNPYGSEGSPDHIALRDYIASSPSIIGLDKNIVGITEYPLKSGDKVDVVFELEDEIIGVEVKSNQNVQEVGCGTLWI